MSAERNARRGGRPTRLEAARLAEKILLVATELFLAQGFAATSIEAVAARSRISKRTFYHRFRDKAVLYQTVVQRLLQRWLAQFETAFEQEAPLEKTLLRSARRMLDIGLQSDALALRRLLLTEAERFPELVRIAVEQGAAKGIERIASLLEAEAHAGRLAIADSVFAATQFQELVLSVPLRRAMGFGRRLTEAELDDWTRNSVALFLRGCLAAQPAMHRSHHALASAEPRA